MKAALAEQDATIDAIICMLKKDRCKWMVGQTVGAGASPGWMAGQTEEPTGADAVEQLGTTSNCSHQVTSEQLPQRNTQRPSSAPHIKRPRLWRSMAPELRSAPELEDGYEAGVLGGGIRTLAQKVRIAGEYCRIAEQYDHDEPEQQDGDDSDDHDGHEDESEDSTSSRRIRQR